MESIFEETIKEGIMKIKVTRNINAPKEALWEYLADYSNIQRFHPMLKDDDGSHFVDANKSCEIGGTRQCNMKDGNYVKERIIEWEEGSHYTVDIYETSMPLISAQASLGIIATGKNSSRVYMNMVVQPKLKILQPLLYLMNKYYALPSILKGLDDLYNKEKTLSLA